MKKPIWIYGPQGSGKSVALQALTGDDKTFYRAQFSGSPNRAELADAYTEMGNALNPNIAIDGFFELDAGQTEFLTTWIKRGAFIIICSQNPPSADFRASYMPVVLRADTFAVHA